MRAWHHWTRGDGITLNFALEIIELFSFFGRNRVLSIGSMGHHLTRYLPTALDPTRVISHWVLIFNDPTRRVSHVLPRYISDSVDHCHHSRNGPFNLVSTSWSILPCSWRILRRSINKRNLFLGTLCWSITLSIRSTLTLITVCRNIKVGPFLRNTEHFSRYRLVWDDP
jgi:hypothetical protein